MDSTPPEVQAFVNIRRVCEIAGFSKSSILRRIEARTFPAAVIREGNVTRWDLASVLQWRHDRIREGAARNAPAEQPGASEGRRP